MTSCGGGCWAAWPTAVLPAGCSWGRPASQRRAQFHLLTCPASPLSLPLAHPMEDLGQTWPLSTPGALESHEASVPGACGPQRGGVAWARFRAPWALHDADPPPGAGRGATGRVPAGVPQSWAHILRIFRLLAAPMYLKKWGPGLWELVGNTPGEQSLLCTLPCTPSPKRPSGPPPEDPSQEPELGEG